MNRLKLVIAFVLCCQTSFAAADSISLPFPCAIVSSAPQRNTYVCAEQGKLIDFPSGRFITIPKETTRSYIHWNPGKTQLIYGCESDYQYTAWIVDYSTFRVLKRIPARYAWWQGSTPAWVHTSKQANTNYLIDILHIGQTVRRLAAGTSFSAVTNDGKMLLLSIDNRKKPYHCLLYCYRVNSSGKLSSKKFLGSYFQEYESISVMWSGAKGSLLFSVHSGVDFSELYYWAGKSRRPQYLSRRLWLYEMFASVTPFPQGWAGLFLSDKDDGSLDLILIEKGKVRKVVFPQKHRDAGTFSIFWDPHRQMLGYVAVTSQKSVIVFDKRLQPNFAKVKHN